MLFRKRRNKKTKSGKRYPSLVSILIRFIKSLFGIVRNIFIKLYGVVKQKFFKKGKVIKRKQPGTMFFSLAVKNVQKSARDYLIYFFTLALGVAMFYAFNSIGDQFAAFQISDRLSYVSFTVGAMAMISVFVCFIIGFLIVYANRFLLKRRKKEMGIYMTLGMDERDISSLLGLETLVIGLLALIVGLPLGILTSRGLMFLSAKMMNLSMESAGFFISFKAVLGTVFFFIILFGIVHLFNKKEIRKLNLIDLLKADRENEMLESRTFISLLGFTMSIALMLTGYFTLLFDPLKNLMIDLGLGVLLISVGTIIFFFSISDIIFKSMENNKGYYYKGLNMFVIRQLSSKIKSSALSIAVISILIFMSVSTIAIGPILGESSVKGTNESMPYDVGITYNYQETGNKESKVSVVDKLNGHDLSIDNIVSEYGELTIYHSDELKEDKFLIDGYKKNKSNERFGEFYISIVTLQDYNRSMELQNKKTITLNENEYALVYNIEEYGDIYVYYAKHNRNPLSLNGHELELKQDGVYKQTLEIENVLMNNGTIIVPDAVVNGLSPNRTVLNANFKSEDSYTIFTNLVYNIPDDLSWITKKDAFVEVTMGNILFSYVGLYLGICFLITAGAVLALQQLSQTSDNQKRLILLQKLGVKNKMMIGAMRKQVNVYFTLPIVLALTHSVILIAFVQKAITNLTDIQKYQYIGLSFGLVFTIYGFYYISTYLGSRRMIMEIISDKK